MRETTADVAVFIEESPDLVWDALTDPTKIEKYYLGAEVETDWQVGSPITWSGEWNGKSYADKGEILAVEPKRRLSYSHWSPLAGTPDDPDHYHVIDIFLDEADGGTAVRLTQSNQSGEVTEIDRQGKADYEKNWRSMLDGLKKVVEGESAPPLT
ncbi:MAG TPA: SRPBCC family protein [Acidimicrobiia bacterium]